MSNIYVEAKGPEGVQAKESLLPTAVSGYERGLAVVYGSDAYHATLVAIEAAVAIGILEEDAINVNNPCSVIEFGQAVAQIGADVTFGQRLAINAAGQLVPASASQPVIAVALESQIYVAPGSFACVFVLGFVGFPFPGEAVTYFTESGAIPVVPGTYALGSAGALAMTLSAPTELQDGVTLFITAETSHGHTITTPADGLYGSKHIVTFAAQGDGVLLRAVGGTWMVISLVGPTPAAIS